MVSKRRERRLVDGADARRSAAAAARSWRAAVPAEAPVAPVSELAVAERWPPDRTGRDRYVEVLLLEQGVGMPVRLREVQLWGRLVAINEDGRVYCPTCMRMVDVGELGRTASVHRLFEPPTEDR